MSVQVPPDANGLVAILGDLIDQNLARDPSRARLCASAGVISVRAADIGLTASVRMGGGDVVLANGAADDAHVRIRADSMTLLELSASPLRFGFPDVFTPQGRGVIRSMRSGALKVHGLVRHPGIVSRLQRLLSAAEA